MPSMYMMPDYYGKALLNGQLASDAQLQKTVDQWDEFPWWRKLGLLTFTITEGAVYDNVKAARHILLSRRNPDGPTARRVRRNLFRRQKQVIA